MKETLEYLFSLTPNQWALIVVVMWLLFKGLRMLILAARGKRDSWL